MPINFVTQAKYVPETVSIICPFSDMLLPGEVISTPTISVTLFTGNDPTPGNILFEGNTIIGGVAVEQRFRLGTPGVIYEILFSVVTNLGNTYEKVTSLAILPEEGSATPTFTIQYETTYPYPYYWYEPLTSLPIVVWGSALYNPIWEEGLSSTVAGVIFANLYGGSVSYNNPHEDITSSPEVIFANLYGGLVSYSYADDGLDTNVAIIWANLYGGSIIYDNPHEDLTSIPTVISATLS